MNTEWNVIFQNEGNQILSTCWSANSQYILSLTDYGLQTTVWSIYSKKTFLFKLSSDSYRYLLPGVSDIRKCCSFSKDKNWMALLYRDSISISQQQDYISIFSCKSWECVHTFTVDTMQAQSVFSLFNRIIH